MPTEAELLNAVLKSPDDDAPQLAYADWCAGQSDPALTARAEMIRHQLDAHRLRQRTGGPAAKAAKLIHQHQTGWIGGLARYVLDVEFSRGFIEQITVKGRTWIESAGAIRRLAPVRHLDLVELTDLFAEVIGSASMEGIRSLGLQRQGLMDPDLEVLAKSPHLGSLRWLSLVGNRVTEDGAVALAASNRLPALSWANFYGNPYDPGEQFAHDQGLIVDSWLTPEGEALERRFGRLKWLHDPAVYIMETEPDRFTID